MPFNLSKEIIIDIFTKHSSVYVKINVDSSPRSAVEGHINISLKKPLEISAIAVSFCRKIVMLNGIDELITEPAYIKETELDTKNICLHKKPGSELIKYSELDRSIETKYDSSSDDLSMKLNSGQHSCGFCIWVPDNLEPTISSDFLSVSYYLKAKVTYTKQISIVKMSNTMKSKTSIFLYTLPRFLHLELLHDHFSVPLCWHIYKDNKTSITFSLPSRILVNNKKEPAVSTLVVHESSASKEEKLAIKQIKIELLQELFYGPEPSRTHKNTKMLFNKSVCFDEINATSTKNSTTLDRSHNCYLKTCSKLKNKKYFDVQFSLENSESLSSLTLGNLIISHILRATITLDDGTDGTPRIINSDLSIFFIASAAEQFFHTLPPYSDFLNSSTKAGLGQNPSPYLK